MNETMTLNFSKICRFCLSDHKTLLPLFNTAEKVQEKFHTISPKIEVSGRVVREIYGMYKEFSVIISA
jgi:hypothetical protein